MVEVAILTWWSRRGGSAQRAVAFLPGSPGEDGFLVEVDNTSAWQFWRG
jgi:hypothetical protein